MPTAECRQTKLALLTGKKTWYYEENVINIGIIHRSIQRELNRFFPLFRTKNREIGSNKLRYEMFG